MTNFNERTITLLYKNISLTLYSRKGWYWLCARGELEMGTDSYILTQRSSDHTSTSFAFWLGCSTVGHWGPKLSVWSWLSLRWHPISNWNCNSSQPSVAPGYIIVWHPPASCGHTHLPPSPNSTTSTGQGDIPISSNGCTCFDVLPLIFLVNTRSYPQAAIKRFISISKCQIILRVFFLLEKFWFGHI